MGVLGTRTIREPFRGRVKIDRNDAIVFSILGGAAGFGFLGWIIAAYATSATVAQWVQSLLTLFAIAVAIWIPLHTEAEKRALRARVSEVIVASALRAWLRVAAFDIGENLKFRSSGERDGERKIDIPPFNVPLDQVAQMRPPLARDVLSLLERRERRQNDIYGAQFYGDETDGLMTYFEQIGHLFWSARRLYRAIAADQELDALTNRPSEIQTVKDAQESAAAYRRLENQQI